MAIKTRTTSSIFSSRTASQRTCLTVEAPITTDSTGTGPVVRMSELSWSHKGVFLVLLTVALVPFITTIRYGFLIQEAGEPYGMFLSRVTSTVSDSIMTDTATRSSSTSKSGDESSTSTDLAAAPVYEGPVRTWESFNGGTFPCYPGERHLMSTEPAHRGFLFHRPHKVGSTTMVGILLRLVHNKARHEPFQQPQKYSSNSGSIPTATTNSNDGSTRLKKCLHRSIHGSALSFEYNQRDIAQSFLFSLMRHPTQRAISEFFHFIVSSGHQEPTDANFLKHLLRPSMANYYLRDMTMKEFGQDNYGPFVTPLKTIVQDILDSFDFIGITERMNESLVVMQMLLGLDTKDIVYTHARSSGSFTNGPPDRPCTYIMKSFLTPRMKEFFAGETWANITRGDLLLYQAASASLDRTIEALGRVEFDQKLQALERGLALVEENCKDRIVHLCSDGGQRLAPQNTTCYVWSEGCDHDCIDELGDI